jgi:hypothetical protein
MQPAEPALPPLLAATVCCNCLLQLFAATACRHRLPPLINGCIRFQKPMAAVDCWA